MIKNITLSGAEHVVKLTNEDSRSCIDVISAKICSILPTPAEDGFTLAEVLAGRGNMLPVFSKAGFTLAEVLITLGIIGVVAAMTIPTLISKIQKQQIEAQLKENYSVIAQAMKLSEEEGAISPQLVVNQQKVQAWFEEFMSKSLKTEVVCYHKPGCWHKSGVVKTLNNKTPTYETNVGNGESVIGAISVTFRTAKGAYFDLDISGSAASQGLFGIDTSQNTLQFYVDVNGDRKPNIIGKDIFIMVYEYDKGLVPAGNDRTPNEIKQNCEQGNGYWCMKYIKDNGWVIPDSVWKRKI